MSPLFITRYFIFTINIFQLIFFFFFANLSIYDSPSPSPISPRYIQFLLIEYIFNVSNYFSFTFLFFNLRQDTFVEAFISFPTALIDHQLHDEYNFITRMLKILHTCCVTPLDPRSHTGYIIHAIGSIAPLQKYRTSRYYGPRWSRSRLNRRVSKINAFEIPADLLLPIYYST